MFNIDNDKRVTPLQGTPKIDNIVEMLTVERR